jgi:hypothetical protein
MMDPPEMRTWLPWSELAGGPRLTLEEYLYALRQFPRSALLIAVARLSILFKYGHDANTVAPNDVTKWAVPQVFAPEYVARVEQAIGLNRVVFFQGQLRRMAAETLRLTHAHPEDGKILPDVSMGGLQLGAGELLHQPHIKVSEELDVMANLVADFLPVYEIDALNDGFFLFLRFYIFLKIIIPRMPKRLVTFDVWALFEKVFGFPLKLYYLFLYAFSIHAQIERDSLKVGDVPPHGGLHISWFDNNTVLTRAEVDAMFNTVSCSLSHLPDTKPMHGYADCEYLRDHPYFRHDDYLYCLDYEFAGSKLESGVLWRIRETMGRKDRFAYFSFWGEVFEEYVAWLFENYPDKSKNSFYRSPRFLNAKDKHPICDAIVMCGTTAVLIEAKLGTCAADVRYSGDYVKFKKFLEDKLVMGTNRPVGVLQLVKAINAILTTSKENMPDWLHGATKFIPLVLTKDDIGSSWMTTTYLNARFRQLFVTGKIDVGAVTPLLSISVATLERAIYALTETAFSDILEERIKEDPQLGRPFEAASTYIHRGMPRRMSKHIEILHMLAQELEADFHMKG